MARGLPVLAWDVGGIGESVVDGETGYLVRAGQDDAFAARLRALTLDDALRAELGGQARRRALTFPSWAEARRRFADACAAGAATAGRPA
jgi:glycosyltransferase involved in cell wall biosynthesis